MKMAVLQDPVNFGKDFVVPKRLKALSLESKNPHPLDEHIKFYEKEHIYFFKDKQLKLSVTSLVHSYFNPFDSDLTIKKMKNGTNWPNPKYVHEDGTPFTASEIKTVWEADGELSRNQGTWMHYNIENYLNGMKTSKNIVKEMSQFKSFYEKEVINMNIIPYRTEWRVVAPDLSLGGSIDFVGKCSDGTYALLDWKRSTKVNNKSKNYPKEYGKPPIENLEDTKANQYSLQLNIYKYLLENYYGLKISIMKIVSCHPDLDEYNCLPVQNMEKEVNDIIRDYKTSL